MNEAETRAELIDPALAAAGWGVAEGTRVAREFQITAGRLEGAGRRGKADKADYVLIYRGKRLAVIEAKKRGAHVTEGLAQAKAYAAKLQIRFTYATNGTGVYQADMQTGAEGHALGFPTPQQLWDWTYAEENVWRDRFAAVPVEDKGGSWTSRYYQDIAIDRVMEVVAAGGSRILITLATGTGKTYVAFQIAWKLYHARWSLNREPTRRPRILFLADRNILADQAYNAFSPFADDARVRIDPGKIRKTGRVPKNGSVFFTIFQTFMTGTNAEGVPSPSFFDYPPDFFDFIIIDECHRGGARDESNWRGILEYFSPAVQLGLTATPKRRDNVDTYAYFGEPVYTYSLREGINDGFLTPFKVKQIATTLDDYVYTSDDDVIEGEVETGKRYTEGDFNRIIEIAERERYRVKTFMEMIDQNQKTIVFCATQDHAAAVRDLINQMKASTNPNYCVRVTANDGAEGETWLRTFQDNEKTIPTILTTSQKLSTGIDARNVRNIVLMRPVNSMIEFKQIVGRGTRLYDGKDYFTIYDFVKAYQHFSDPEWDGEPAEPPEPDEPRSPRPPKQPGDDSGTIVDPPPSGGRIKIRLADGKERSLQHIAATMFYSPDGRPLSAAEFIERLFGDLPALFKDEAELRKLWGDPTTRKGLLDNLNDRGYGREQLSEIRRMIDAEKSDLFDVLAYIAFALPTITRAERVATRKTVILPQYEDNLQAFLDFVLFQYVERGVEELDQDKLADLMILKYRGLPDATAALGGNVRRIREAFVSFQPMLYS
ncbi:type I site-specific deoxyribonuclease subunit HsdR [Rhizobium sp. NXC14]|uniref:EcoAI/FtnUII family type I restriction enzme subunit R n=1 Tax=Rhizobium sp. NXC14 TaxID=1981173 RepID=UPI000A2032B0|nr:type I restriction endonuclease subunit R [Rhizobium sp. NXC14]ARO31298.1 type I site-specific deoxyribonuclease subunit HsdR [Rhizobium sp. NXC14]